MTTWTMPEMLPDMRRAGIKGSTETNDEGLRAVGLIVALVWWIHL
jgi:hypothetical protein